MTTVWKISQEHKELLTSQIQWYFEKERSEELGNLAAGNLLDFVLKQIGPIVYNQALSDARTVLLQQIDRVEEEIYALERPLALTDRD